MKEDIIKTLVKEMKGLNPTFDGADIRGELFDNQLQLMLKATLFWSIQRQYIGFISQNVRMSLFEDLGGQK